MFLDVIGSGHLKFNSLIICGLYVENNCKMSLFSAILPNSTIIVNSCL